MSDVLRDTRIRILMEAYRRLEKASNRELTAALASEIEGALADVQLLGSRRQVELAQEFILQVVNQRTGSFDPLLAELRKEIREALGLEAVSPQIQFLRIQVQG
jgi:hypothetical protein